MRGSFHFAGFAYTGERFEKYFRDFVDATYTINRYKGAPKPVYDTQYELVKDKNNVVLTTNVDHCFQKAGFDKHRLFYT